MRDGPFLRVVKRLARWRYALDLRVARALWKARGDPWFRLGGECRRCARCCEAPSIRANGLVWFMPTLRAAFLWWQRAVNGFELLRLEPRERVFVFRCTHFDWATRSCDSYDSRPGLCRDYPRALLFQPRPEFLPGCGYRAVSPQSGRFLRVLEDSAMDEGTRQRLRRELHLE